MSTKLIAVITGATSGLGELVAVQLAECGYDLILTARSQERAAATRKRIYEHAPSAQVDVFYGDLSVMRDVTRIGTEIVNTHPRIDVLLNNAGIHAFEPRTTSEGLPEMMAVNYLAPWLLTHLLRPSLQKASTARVINVASEASRRHGVLTLPDDLTDTTPFTARGSSAIYGKTKLLNIMFTAELARQWAGTGISINALNPGFNVTGLGRELKYAGIIERILKFLQLGDPRKGASIITRLIMNPEFAEVTGGYFNVGTAKSIKPVAPGGVVDLQKKLWKATQELLKQHGYLE